MKTIVGAVAAALLTLGLLAAAPVAPASADTPGYVSRVEFGKARTGWAINRVDRLFDTVGRVVSQGGGWMTRDYRAFGGRTASLTYEMTNGVWRMRYKYLSS